MGERITLKQYGELVLNSINIIWQVPLLLIKVNATDNATIFPRENFLQTRKVVWQILLCVFD